MEIEVIHIRCKYKYISLGTVGKGISKKKKKKRSFLSDVLMISGVDGSYAPTYGNGQINYGNNYYFNSNHNINSNTFLYPASGSSGAQILNLANQGAAYILSLIHI